MKTLLRGGFSLLIASFAAHASAELHINPGLWLIQHHGNMGSGEMSIPIPDASQLQGLMQNLPPEARAQMEKHMGKNGTAMVSGEDVKVCVSPEQAASNTFPTDPSGKCKLVNNVRTGNTLTLKMQCTQGSMDAVVTLQDATAWNSTMKGAMKNGEQTYTMDMQATGKWLGHDCGTLKPLDTAATQH